MRFLKINCVDYIFRKHFSTNYDELVVMVGAVVIVEKQYERSNLFIDSSLRSVQIVYRPNRLLLQVKSYQLKEATASSLTY